MPLEKIFKWSEKDYSMREFVDIFSYRLPQIIFITLGWQGRDEDHTFSGDEIYRIAAVKRQRRIVAKHGSGYFVSIPTTINKKVDLFFPDGEVQRSASLDELVAALQIHDDGSLKMMFENDEKVSFSFGPDEGAEINFGKMKIIDVYDERYLVGHSVCEGKVYSPVMPIPIPVYMTIELVPAVGLDGGTEEDFRKVLADIEEQMRRGITEVEDYDEIMLFPHDITGSDYEYIRPCDWAPGILSGASCEIDVPEMTSSPAYPLVGRPSPADLARRKSAWTNVKKTLNKRTLRCPLNKPLPPDPPVADPPVPTPTAQVGAEGITVEHLPHAVVAPVKRRETPVVPKRSRVAEQSEVQLPLPRRNPGNVRAASTTPSSTTPSSTPLGAAQNITSRPTGDDDATYTTEDDDPLYDDLRKYKSGSATNVAGSNEYKALTDVPPDIRTLTPEQLASCMRMLKIPEHCICAFREKDVDGDILVSIDKTILTDEFKFGKFDAIKMMKFAKDNYRPKVT